MNTEKLSQIAWISLSSDPLMEEKRALETKNHQWLLPLSNLELFIISYSGYVTCMVKHQKEVTYQIVSSAEEHGA